MDSELSAKAVISAKPKRVEDVMGMGQGDDRLPGTPRTMTDVPLIQGRIKISQLLDQEE